MARIPLLAIFAVQSLIVAAAFIAITVMFVTSQKESTDKAVHALISNAMESNRQKVMNPLEKHVQPMREAALRITGDTEHNMACTFGNTDPVTQYGAYFAEALTQIQLDPSVVYLYQSVYTPHILHENGDPFWQSCGCAPDHCYYSNRTDEIPLEEDGPTLPFNSSSLTVGEAYEYDITYERWITDFLEPMTGETVDGQWMPLDAYFDPHLNDIIPLMSFYVPVAVDPVTNKVTNAVGVDLTISSLRLIVKGLLSTDNSINALYEMNSGTLIASSSNDFLSYNNETQLPWASDDTPSVELNAGLAQFLAECPDATCNQTTIEVDDMLLSGVKVRSDSGLNMVLIELTPREYYYASGDSARTNGIIGSVVVTLIVMATCLFIFVAVSSPVKELRRNMNLAALMRNDQVVPTTSLIMEVAEMSATFDRMNAQLLQARAFVPKSLYALNEDSYEDEDCDDEGAMKVDDDEGSSHGGGTHSHGGLSQGDASYQNHRHHRASVSNSDSVSITSHGTKNGRRGGLNTSDSMITRNAAVLYINVRDFHSIMKTMTNAKFFAAYNALVTAVSEGAEQNRGVVDAFHGDHFVLTFNAARNCGAPASKAARTALAIQHTLAEQDVFPSLTMGLGYGVMQVGNMGSRDLKKFCTVGPAFTQAVELEALARRSDPTLPMCFVSHTAARDLGTGFYCTLLGETQHSAKVWGVVGVIGDAAAADEWLYELKESESRNPFVALNECMATFLKGDVDRAKTLAAETRPDPEPKEGTTASTLLSVLRRGWAHIDNALTAPHGGTLGCHCE